MNHDLAQILGGSLWLMEPKAFRAMVKRAASVTAEAIQAAQAALLAYAERPPSLNMMGDVAVIHMSGPITYRPSWFSMIFGGATIESMQTQFRMALRDESVKTIAFRCDSPGGEVLMVPEFADEIFAARGQKPIIAVADTDVCSAALWIAAQADQLHVSASSYVGSVGCYLEHDDLSGMLEQEGVKITLIHYGKHKVDGNIYEPLSDEVKASLQEQVDAVGIEFDTAMARGRGVTRKVVSEQFGQGKVFRGKKAIEAGLADKMGTFGQVMGKLTKGRTAVGARADAPVAPIVASAEPMTTEAQASAEPVEVPVAPVPVAAASSEEPTPAAVDPVVADAQAAADRDHLAIAAALSAD
jgi:signal peptide peptidase SppA